MDSFIRLAPAKGSVACGTCGAGARSDLDMMREITVGFGSAGYSKDGEELWSSDYGSDVPRVEDVERMAKNDPDHDWRIWFFAPLYEAEYQRQGEKLWVLVRAGDGFA